MDDVRRAVPFSTKADVLAFYAQFPHGGTQPDDPTTRQLHLTSGTSGVGREVYPRTAADLAGLGTPGAYELIWAGLVPGDRLMLTMPYSQTMAGPYFQDTCLAAGVIPVNAFSGSTPDRLEDLGRFACAGISATPSYVHRLAVEAKQMGISPMSDLPSLRTIFLSGEPYSAAWAAEQSEFWGVTLFEGWGATQTLGIAMSTCERGSFTRTASGPQHAILHGLDHRCWIEVLDPDGRPVSPGDFGEIVVTLLRPGAQPSIRFRMGDKVKALEQGSCECGRPFTCYQAGNIGRVDDMIKIRGMNVWPEAVDAVVLRAPVVDYRGRIFNDAGGKESVELLVEVEPGTGFTEVGGLLNRLRAEIKAAVGVNVDPRLVDHGRMPEQRFKSRRWIDERAVRTGGPAGE